MPHKYWYCGTFDFKKVSKTGFYMIFIMITMIFSKNSILFLEICRKRD